MAGNRQVCSNAIRIFDYGPDVIDRYTVVFMNEPIGKGMFTALAMSENPTQEFCIHVEALVGPHLGREISFEDLPEQCRKVVEEEC